MTEQEQINALKAQVNFLQNFLVQRMNAMDDISSGLYRQYYAALEATPAQCLDELKAIIIRSMLLDLPTYGAILDDGYGEDWFEVVKHSDIVFYVNKLQEQAK